MDTTPPSLLQRLCRPGEDAAWAWFVRLYTPLLCHWARRLGLHLADAADLVQDVFAVLAQELPRFQDNVPQPFSAWLWAVTLHAFRARHRRASGPEAGEGQPEAPAGAEGAAVFLEKEYRSYVVRRALELMGDEFPPKTRKAFWEFAVSGRRAEEVAAELGTTVGDVYLAQARVLRRLRTDLEGLLD
jgi:RNA polymerase sigma-70 factor (ECF subfamily)